MLSTTLRIVFSLLLLAITPTTPSLLSSSRVTSCINDGSTDPSVANMDCEKKFVLTLAVDSGQANGTEVVEAIFDSATDDEGNVVRLEKPWRITVAKSVPFIVYPITYVRSFNADPYEVIHYQSFSLNPFSEKCVDSGLARDPTCGWVFEANGSGTRIENSQGFCCTCSLSDYLGLHRDQSRGGLTCKLFGSQSSSAHCLRFGELWYAAYEVGDAQTFFEIRVYLSRYNDEGEALEDFVELSPENPGGSILDGKLVAKLVGDFAAWKSAPVLSSKYLFRPYMPTTHPRVKGPYSMVIDRSLVTLDGRECNKIGVSFDAFQTESDRCSQLPESCLHNQLEDYNTMDEEKRSQGLRGDYYLENFGESLIAYLGGNSKQLYLTIRMERIQASVVVITLAADDIRLITNRSPGIIILASVDTFEAQSKNGLMRVKAFNMGIVVSDYTLAITDCTEGILTIQAQRASIYPRRTHEFIFQIYSTTPLAGHYKCTARLYDSQQTLIHSLVIYFNTTATVDDMGSQGGSGGVEGGSTVYPIPRILTCDDLCPFVFDLPCFLIKRCWKKLGTMCIILGVLWCCWKFRRQIARAILGVAIPALRRKKSGSPPSDPNKNYTPAPSVQYPKDQYRPPKEIKVKKSKKKLTDDEIEELLESRRPVYFNVRGAKGTMKMKDPGKNFSLMGKLETIMDTDAESEEVSSEEEEEEDEIIAFVIDRKHMWQRKYRLRGKYVSLVPRQRLHPSLKETHMDRESLKIMVTRSPRFECINTMMKGKQSKRGKNKVMISLGHKVLGDEEEKPTTPREDPILSPSRKGGKVISTHSPGLVESKWRTMREKPHIIASKGETTERWKEKRDEEHRWAEYNVARALKFDSPPKKDAYQAHTPKFEKREKEYRRVTTAKKRGQVQPVDEERALLDLLQDEDARRRARGLSSKEAKETKEKRKRKNRDLFVRNLQRKQERMQEEESEWIAVEPIQIYESESESEIPPRRRIP